MQTILRKEQPHPTICQFRLAAPRIAAKYQAGQFLILRPTTDGERIPLTITQANSEEGWIEIIFQILGSSTKTLATLTEGDAIPDVAGPLGKPTHIKNFGRCVCIGGGLGIAPLRPIAEKLKQAGNHVTSIIGARNQDLLILEDDIKNTSDVLFVTTDNGSYGHHGYVSDVLNKLLQDDKTFDYAIVIGPPIMMKVTSTITIDANIPTYCSLNPIMVDGTGMCGCCRVTVFDKTRFACVDGPEFDAAGVDWDELMKRLSSYLPFEQAALAAHTCRLTGEQNNE